MLLILTVFLFSGCSDGARSRLYNIEREFRSVVSCHCLSDDALSDYRKGAVAELRILRKCDTLRVWSDSLRKQIKEYRP